MPRTRRTAAKAPAGPVAPIAERVVETRTQDPKTVSTRIIDATQQHAWVVGCENAQCSNRILVAKYDFRPVSFANPNGPAIKTIYSAPGARRCGLHIG